MKKALLFNKNISEMDIESLASVLVENAFTGYTNATFLEKLSKLFGEFRASGNTSLKLHSGLGICSCNQNNKVLCFIANKTSDYFALSYKEDENNYYSFSTSCNEVSLNNKPHLNKFYYFSIKPESTLEYKMHLKSSNPIREYKAFSFKAICSMHTIELWLERYGELYNTTVALLEDKKQVSKLNSVELLVKEEFEVLYGKLSVLSKIHKKETYFKEQLETYKKIKDSISNLEKWFAYQHENKREYKLFSAVFYDSRALTHFSLQFDALTLNTEDFKYILKYMSIIEDTKTLQFQGTIKSIDDLEVYKKTKTTRTYKKRRIVLSVDDFYCSEYQVIFTDGRVEHLDNLCEGQYVKVFARLTGLEFINTEGAKEHKHNLYGWRLEKLPPNPTIKKNNKEMDLYYKYILPLPF